MEESMQKSEYFERVHKLILATVYTVYIKVFLTLWSYIRVNIA